MFIPTPPFCGTDLQLYRELSLRLQAIIDTHNTCFAPALVNILNNIAIASCMAEVPLYGI